MTARRKLVASPLLLTTGMVEADALGGGGVFLRPGDWLFGRGAVRVSTLLGSCVALALWAPRQQLGAVCHCVLPACPEPRDAGAALDGRYGDDSARWLEQRFGESGCRWSDLEVAVAGGACGDSESIGPANVAWARRWAAGVGLAFMQEDVGGRVVRRLTFNLADGSLMVAHGGRLGAAPGR